MNMDRNEETVILTGTAAALIYQNPENGYAVLRLDTGEDTVTCVGCMPGISPGEELELTGRWTAHTAYGEQFRAETVIRRLPTGPAAIFRYLATGAVKHVGPALAREIVDRFGAETLEILEDEPEKLAEIRGITEDEAAQATFENACRLFRINDHC